MHKAPFGLAVVLAMGCSEPAAPRESEVDALLQRLDAMSTRLAALEEALEQTERPPAAVPTLDTTDEAIAMPDTIERAEPPVPRIRIDVAADGLSIDGQSFTREQAALHLEQVARDAPQTELALLAGPEVPYEDVVAIMDLARQAGLERIAISARVHGSADAEPETATAAR
ncbi:MAG: biopolymer transporter ExbD [Nannocystaceae bacterium]